MEFICERDIMDVCILHSTDEFFYMKHDLIKLFYVVCNYFVDRYQKTQNHR